MIQSEQYISPYRQPPIALNDFCSMLKPEWLSLHLTERHFRSKEDYLRYLFVKKGMVKGVRLVYGRPRSGKTLYSVVHAMDLRDLFGIPVLMNFHPYPAFGPYEYFENEVLIEELNTVTALTKQKKSWKDKVEIEGEVKRLKMYGHTVLIDEASKLIDKRRSASNVNLYMCDIAKEYAHYDLLLLAINHREAELDSRFVEYITFRIDCSWGTHVPELGEYKMSNSLTGENYFSTLYGPNYYKYYDSFCPIAMRQSIKTPKKEA